MSGETLQSRAGYVEDGWVTMAGGTGLAVGAEKVSGNGRATACQNECTLGFD